MKIKRKSVIITIIMLIGIMVFSAFSLVVFNVLKSKKNEQSNLNVEAAYYFDNSNGALTYSDTEYKDNDKFYIQSVRGLKSFSKTVDNGCSFSNKIVYLSNDIDMAGQTFQPIGACMDGGYITREYYWFSGEFDGQGHTIKNLYTEITYSDIYSTGSLSAYRYIGFFIDLSSRAIVRNLCIENYTIKNSAYDGYISMGCLAGSISGTDVLIENCWINGATIDTKSTDWFGGIVGAIMSDAVGGDITIKNCFIEDIVFTNSDDFERITRIGPAKKLSSRSYNFTYDDIIIKNCGNWSNYLDGLKTIVVDKCYDTLEDSKKVNLSDVGGVSDKAWYYTSCTNNGNWPMLRAFVGSWQKIYFVGNNLARNVAKENDKNGDVIDYIEIPTSCISNLPSEFSGDTITICDRKIFAPHSECQTVTWDDIGSYLGYKTYQYKTERYSRTITVNLYNEGEISTLTTFTKGCGFSISIYFDSYPKAEAYKSCNIDQAAYIYTPPALYYISSVDFVSGTTIHEDTTITITIVKKTYTATFN